MVDWSKPIQTRDGRKARLLGTAVNERLGLHTKVVCIPENNSGEYRTEWVHYVNSYNGRVYESDDRNCDIINVPERKGHFCQSLGVTCDEGHDSYFLVRCYHYAGLDGPEPRIGKLASAFAAPYCPFCGEKAGT